MEHRGCWGSFDRYQRRGWLEDESCAAARAMFAGEAVRLLKLKVLPLVTLHLRLLASAWRLVEKHHIHQVDALQITSANHVGANELYTGGEDLHKAASAEGVRGVVLK